MTPWRSTVIGMVVMSLASGLLLLLPLVRIPYMGSIFVIIYLGFGLVIATHFGSDEPWNLTPLLEEDTK
jgi:hypothetical protein